MGGTPKIQRGFGSSHRRLMGDHSQLWERIGTLEGQIQACQHRWMTLLDIKDRRERYKAIAENDAVSDPAKAQWRTVLLQLSQNVVGELQNVTDSAEMIMHFKNTQVIAAWSFAMNVKATQLGIKNSDKTRVGLLESFGLDLQWQGELLQKAPVPRSWDGVVHEERRRTIHTASSGLVKAVSQ